jgi:hypothetical protein
MNIPLNVYVSKAFNLLHANTHYTLTSEGKNHMHCQNNLTGGGTVVYKWEVEMAFGKGWLVRE